MKQRTRARALALQVLYETDLTDHLPGDILKQRLDDMLEEARIEEAKKFPHKKIEEIEVPDSMLMSEDLVEFARRIIFGVIPLADDLDQFIAKYAPEWPLDQIATIDRNILRMALWEFAVSRETPVKVAINEAVELAKSYGSDSAPRFVNGVLGTLAERENELRQILKNKTAKETS